MDEKKVSSWLPCELSEEEVLKAAREMAERLAKLDELEDQLASVKKQIGSDIDAANAQVGKFRDMVRTGIEHRNVMCTIRYEWARGKKITQRDDTGEIVREEAVSESERQQNLLENQQHARVQ